jgi:hypothetical protein
VDIYAKKEGVTRVIKVKKESRGIADDIVKCQKLLQFPEVTEAYVAAPDLLISPGPPCLCQFNRSWSDKRYQLGIEVASTVLEIRGSETGGF